LGVDAALRPAGKPRKVAGEPPRERVVELERLTGVSRDVVRSRRKAAGVHRPERRGPDRSWVPGIRKLLGKVPDAEIARRVGKSPSDVHAVRVELSIAAAPKVKAVHLHPRDRAASTRQTP
jgi:hypothetical protein